MKVLGIVVEYNPFHNGHIYHIEQSKAVTGSDAVVCVMSGNFIQRGEPALINKFARTHIALRNGVDLVIELPHPFAMSSAEHFAYGAVKLLDSIGIVDCISFGSEHGSISSLEIISDILLTEPVLYKDELKKQLEQGNSFPVCRQNALKKYLEGMKAGASNTELSQLLETSNNILGIEYLKAIKKINSSIKPHTIKRVSNQYNTPELTGSISSATAIRQSILGSVNNAVTLNENASQAIPKHTKEVLEEEFVNGRGPNSLKAFEGIIFALLRQLKPEQISLLPDVTEGLEYRIKSMSENYGSLEELINGICTKRYTQTRIRRILSSLLTGLTKADYELFMWNGGPQYARILGFNDVGRQLLSRIKKASVIPTITRPADYKNSDNAALSRMLKLEVLSTNVYVLAYKNPAHRKAGQDYTENVVIVK